MASKILKYSIEDFESIAFNGFDYQIPDNILEVISQLAVEVGSPDYVKTPIFPKKEILTKQHFNINSDSKKRKNNKGMEMLNDNDWEVMKNFQPTKIESKPETESEIYLIRFLINKLTDKNYNELSLKIFDVVEKIIFENNLSELEIIGNNIFDIASSNRYYSKIYAQLYCDLSKKFDFIKTAYISNLERFTDLFNIIEYVDPNNNYDKFCEINKMNEKRKSLASFYLNLMNLDIISPSVIRVITRNLLSKIYEYISIDNKKNEVDELTETVSILYHKDMYENKGNNDYELINGNTISEIIEKIANSKVKDYKSLTNKSLFKFMDLIDM
jgi:hypothetical protein